MPNSNFIFRVPLSQTLLFTHSLTHMPFYLRLRPCLAAWSPGAWAGSRSEQSEEDGQQEEAVQEPEHDDEDDHLGEGDDHVAGMADQRQHSQDCGGCSWKKRILFLMISPQ